MDESCHSFGFGMEIYPILPKRSHQKLRLFQNCDRSHLILADSKGDRTKNSTYFKTVIARKTPLISKQRSHQKLRLFQNCDRSHLILADSKGDR